MQHAALQSLYVAPRAGVDPRIANTVTAERQCADNGILYMLDDSRDIGKYRVMSQADLKKEKIVYEEVAATVQKRSSKVSTEKRNIQVGPPVGQRARQIQYRKWDNKMREKRAAAAESRSAVSTKASTGYSVSRTASTGNRPGSAPPGGRRQTPAPAAHSSRGAPRHAPRPASSTVDDSELETLKYKYAQNLGVIERLAAEKEEMARTLEMIQTGRIDPTSTANIGAASAEASQHSIHSEDYDNIPPPMYTEEPDEERYAWKAKSASGRLSAAEASQLFDTSRSTTRGRSSTVQSQTPRSRSPNIDPRHLRGFGGAPGSPDGFVRSKSFDGPRRARSAPRTRLSGGAGLSFELQADYDRYLQKKRNLQENERKAAHESELYEAEQRRRFARASKQGEEFRGIKERDESINMIRQKRAERVMRQSYNEREKELDVEADKKRKYAMAAQASFGTVNDMGQSFSWRDIEEQDEIRRRERVELRKMELANSVAYPSQEIEQSVEQWKLKKQGNEVKVNNYISGIEGQQRRASDPKQIISKLERQHNLWERRLEREMQQSRTSRTQVHVDPKVVEMERRNAEYTERRRAKALEKERAERAALESKKTKEAERMKTLLNAKPPAWKLTKTAEDRAKLAKAALEEEVQKQRKEALLQKKKEGRSKEISAFLHSIISQESGGSGRKSEIRMDDSGVPLAVIEKRRADALKAKENKDRIKEYVAKRPSLIERHNQQVAQANARAAGLQKVANAICDCSGTSKQKKTSRSNSQYGANANSKENDEDDYADEFFDFEERLEIGH